VSTASVVLNAGHRRKKVSAARTAAVREAARRLGYAPNYHARSMKLGRADSIGVVLDTGLTEDETLGGHRLSNSYFGALVGAIDSRLTAKGFCTTIIGGTGDATALQRTLAALRQRRLDGVVVLTGTQSVAGVRQFVEADRPAVLVEYPTEIDLPVVNWDERKGVALAIEHLAGLGHREILWLGPEGLDSPAGAREVLFVREAWDAQRRGSSCRFRVRPTLGQADFPDAAVADGATEALLQLTGSERPPFTGIVCFNDATAIGACRALTQMGMRIPEDVSVVGIDDLHAAFCIPRLTSISHRLKEMGKRAADMLNEAIGDTDAWHAMLGRRVVVEPTLSVRESTGPAPETGGD